MFRHILVPLDLSHRNERTLRVALDLARAAQARVTLLHVIQRVPHVPPAELRAFYAELMQRSRRTLASATRGFERARVAIRSRVTIGDPTVEIIRTVRAGKVDLVVMGSHRVVLGKPGQGLGTTSYKVGVACPCSILMVK
jgi:nucleotide-binding universal stress UspA family protein